LYRWDDTVHSYACTGWVLDRDRLCQTVDTGCHQIRYHIFGEQSQRTVCSRRDNGYMVSTVQAAKKHRSSRTSWGTTFQDRGSQQLWIRRYYRCSWDTGCRVRQYVIWFVRRRAQALYKYMLRLVHTVWSRNSHVRLFVRHRRQ
jgi:hypothetical protein